MNCSSYLVGCGRRMWSSPTENQTNRIGVDSWVESDKWRDAGEEDSSYWSDGPWNIQKDLRRGLGNHWSVLYSWFWVFQNNHSSKWKMFAVFSSAASLICQLLTPWFVSWFSTRSKTSDIKNGLTGRKHKMSIIEKNFDVSFVFSIIIKRHGWLLGCESKFLSKLHMICVVLYTN